MSIVKCIRTNIMLMLKRNAPGSHPMVSIPLVHLIHMTLNAYCISGSAWWKLHMSAAIRWVYNTYDPTSDDPSVVTHVDDVIEFTLSTANCNCAHGWSKIVNLTFHSLNGIKSEHVPFQKVTFAPYAIFVIFLTRTPYRPFQRDMT